MSRLDLVIFGATGYTGQKAVEEIARVDKKYGNLTVAGRSQTKLRDVITEVSKKTGQDLTSIKQILANVEDGKSLEAMCSQAKVIVNCSGSYRLCGEPVVKAAVESKTHYVDLSGDLQFIEAMQLKYNRLAREAGVYVVTSCGLGSIPNDMGVVFLQQQFDGTLNSVESYISTEMPSKLMKEWRRGLVPYNTWESLVCSIARGACLAPVHRGQFSEELIDLKPKMRSRYIFRRDGKFCVSFPGTDASIVHRTQRHLHEVHHKRPVQFRPYLILPSLCIITLSAIPGIILYLMSKIRFTRNLLLKYPRIFSFGVVSSQADGPNEEAMSQFNMFVELYGEGWPKGANIGESAPSKKIAAKILGAKSAYDVTATAVIISAITIIKQQDKMPGTGGVLTTGAAFYDTDLIKLLDENGATFKIIDNK